VKSVLGEFNAGAFLHALTKVLSQIWWLLITTDPPVGGYGGSFLRLCSQFTAKNFSMLRKRVDKNKK